MKKEIKGLDLYVYEEVLDNGLTVYLVPKNNITSIYATYTTKYGGNDTEFYVDDKLVKVPDGIAHFLEHKMFEQESGIDVASEFSRNGVSSNAMTSNYKTTYLFDGSSKFYENLDLLLNYVGEPYYTDSNVNKEKHIIEQEIDMYADNPYKASFLALLKNIFVYDHSRVPVIGSKESINTITKEDLYLCYNTFYDPHNMFLVITGNIDVEETIKRIRLNQSNKRREYHKFSLKEENEPLNVLNPYVEVNMNVTVPKLALGFKLSIKDLNEKTGLTSREMRRFLKIFTSCKLGSVSTFLENLRKEEILTSSLDYSFYSTDDYIILIIACDTKNPDILVDRVKKELDLKEVDKSLFDLKKRGMIASTVYTSENIYSINQKIISDILYNNQVEYDILDAFKALDYDKFNDFIKELDFSNTTTVVVKGM